MIRDSPYDDRSPYDERPPAPRVPVPRLPVRTPSRLPPRQPSRSLAPRRLAPRAPVAPRVPRKPPVRKPVPLAAPPDKYKSRGESLISMFLKDCGLKFYYEYPIIIIDDDGKQRIWYPDFWIPELSIVVEYFGMVDDAQYLELVKKKETLYRKLNIDFIGVSNHMVQLEKNWEKFIIMRMLDIMDSKDPIYHTLQGLKQKYTW